MQVPGQRLHQLAAAAGPRGRRTRPRRCSTRACSRCLLLSGPFCSLTSSSSMPRHRARAAPARRLSSAEVARRSPGAGCRPAPRPGRPAPRRRCRRTRACRSPRSAFGASTSCRKALSPFDRRPRSERGRDPPLGLRGARCVEGQHVRQHDRVGLGVRQVVHAAEDVADLVVQPRPGRRERDGGQVRRRTASARGPRSPAGSAITAGSPVASARIPSPASARSIGSTRGPHIESTQCASAFSPEATRHRAPASDTVSVASYTTERGRTRASTPVVLRARSVRPHTFVASEPA